MDRRLLLKFKSYIKNKDSYLGKFVTKSGDILLVQKWSNLNTFDITHLNKNGNHIKKIYNNLYPFDCYNLLEELMYI